MFQIDVHQGHDGDSAIEELAGAIDRYAELVREKPSNVVAKLTGIVERMTTFEELRGRFDCRAGINRW